MDLNTYYFTEDWGWFVDTENNITNISKKRKMISIHSTSICFENTKLFVLLAVIIVFYLFTNANIANIAYNY
jgi:hypothetical protein